MEESGPCDVRDEMFRGLAGKTFSACIIVEEEGIVVETAAAAEEAGRLGLFLESIAEEGTRVRAGDVVARFRGTPKQLAMAEEVLIGVMAKPSGIASAAYEFAKRAGPKPRVVCGAWKKMPPALKEAVRRAVVAGGGSFRIVEGPFVYLDKNYIEMLGGIRGCMAAASGLNGRAKVVQVKGRYKDVAAEACEAAACGASVVFIDTGNKGDIARVSEALSHAGLRQRVEIAFAGNIVLGDMAELRCMDVDVLDVGRAIVDAPLLDMRMEVAAEASTGE